MIDSKIAGLQAAFALFCFMFASSCSEKVETTVPLDSADPGYNENGPSDQGDTDESLSADTQQIDDLYDVTSGVAAFDPPRDMTRGVKETIRLVIGSEQSVEDVEAKAEDEGNPVSEALDLGLWVCAELIAENFAVEQDLEQCYSRGRSRYKVISWNVTPEKGGNQIVQVQVSSYAQKGGELIDSIPSDAISVSIAVTGSDKMVGFFDEISKVLLSLKGMLAILLSVVGIIAAIVWRSKRIGQKPDKLDID